MQAGAMPTWIVQKYVTANGKCPIDKWLSALTAKDKIRLRTAVENMERVEKLPPRTIEKYKTTETFQMKVKGDNKQLRPFGVQTPGNKFVLLSGGIEKGGAIPQPDIDRAERLRKEFENGKGSVKGYFED